MHPWIWIVIAVLAGLILGSRFLSPLGQYLNLSSGVLKAADKAYWNSSWAKKTVNLLSWLVWPFISVAIWLFGRPNLTNHWLLAFAIGHFVGWLWFTFWVNSPD